jgi:hypothetical protein
MISIGMRNCIGVKDPQPKKPSFDLRAALSLRCQKLARECDLQQIACS